MNDLHWNGIVAKQFSNVIPKLILVGAKLKARHFQSKCLVSVSQKMFHLSSVKQVNKNTKNRLIQQRLLDAMYALFSLFCTPTQLQFVALKRTARVQIFKSSLSFYSLLAIIYSEWTKSWTMCNVKRMECNELPILLVLYHCTLCIARGI